VIGMAARDGRHLAQPLQGATVTDAARDGRAAAARGSKLLAARDAAIRHIGDEARAGIAIEHNFLVLIRLARLAGVERNWWPSKPDESTFSWLPGRPFAPQGSLWS